MDRLLNIIKNNFVMIILVNILLLQILGVIYTEIYPILRLKNSVNQLNNEVTSDNLQHWIKSYALASNIKASSPLEVDNESLLKSFENYNTSLDKQDSKLFIELPKIHIDDTKQYDREIDPPVVTQFSERIPVGEKVILNEGEKYIQNETHIALGSHTIIFVNNVEENIKPKTLLIGQIPRDSFIDSLSSELIKIQNDDELTTEFFDDSVVNSDTIKKLEFQSMNINFLQEEKIYSGEISLIDTSCSSNYNLKYGYQLETDKYTIHDLDELVLKDCRVVQSFSPPKETKMLTCTDCKLAPVDKTFFLPSTYAPALVPTNLPGGGYLTSETTLALNQMANELKNQGVNVFITSAFRSYQQQQEAFNYWVNRELATGVDLQTARARANIYSAFPGHSEHQLGTTLDIRCEDCSAFSKDVASNPVYQFLQKRAHEYGFVISYPAGKQHLTGYTYEPWHIRYIGVNLATELFNRNYQDSSNSEYLTKFLIEKSMY